MRYETCRAPGCAAKTPKPFCKFHWELAPKALQTEWHHRDRREPEAALLSRLAAAIAAAQHGPRLPL